MSSMLRSLTLLVIAASHLAAQIFTANLTGLVTDSTGGAIPAVTVKVTNLATNEARQSVAGSEGRYTFSQLLPGAYELRAEAAGFKAFVQRGITLRASQSAAFDFSLEIGEVSQRVEVATSVVQLDTQTANQSVTLNRDMVLALPTNVRNPFALVHATAGVTAPATGISQSVADQNHDRFGFNGGRSTTTSILLDGVSVTTGNGWNGLILSPSVDSVAEVQIIRNSYDSQYGRSGGGVVSVVTKGGGSAYHGTAFDFMRNSVLDANTWVNNRGGNPRPMFQRNQFGGNFSGPIWKSRKLYFFAGFEGLRQGSPANSTVTLPTALERNGDFSATRNPNGSLSLVFNPFTNRPNPSGAGIVRDPFPNNRIPASIFDPVGVKAVGLYPQPTGPGDPITAARNYAATGKTINTSDRTDMRADWARSEKHTMYGRYSRAWRILGTPPNIWQAFTTTGLISGNPRYQFTIGNTFVPNPTWVINVLVGHGRWNEKQRAKEFGRVGIELGLPASLVGQVDIPNLPQFYMTDYSNIGHSRDLNNVSRTDNFQVNVTKERGVHSIRFGFAWESNKTTGGGLFSPEFTFDRGMTSGPVAAVNSSTSGNAVASLLLGTGASGNVQKPALGASNRIYYAGYMPGCRHGARRGTNTPGSARLCTRARRGRPPASAPPRPIRLGPGCDRSRRPTRAGRGASAVSPSPCDKEGRRRAPGSACCASPPRAPSNNRTTRAAWRMWRPPTLHTPCRARTTRGPRRAPIPPACEGVWPPWRSCRPRWRRQPAFGASPCWRGRRRRTAQGVGWLWRADPSSDRRRRNRNTGGGGPSATDASRGAIASASLPDICNAMPRFIRRPALPGTALVRSR